jgi:oligopeptide transport system permease protein
MQEKAFSQEVYESLVKHYGFDRPLPSQYFLYLSELVKGNLGPSMVYHHRSVQEIIGDAFPVSAILGLEALCLAIPFGIGFGVLAALKEKKWPDTILLIISGVLFSLPSFLLATALQYELALKWGFFPVARWGTFIHSILPAISLAVMPGAFLMRLVRANMIEVMQQDYIEAAMAKGMSLYQVVYRHALRNALLPLCGYLAQISTNILVGSFVIEKIFSIPGLGYWFVSSIANRDYPVILGTTLFYSSIMLGLLLIAEILQGYFDPRLREV